MNFLFRCYYYTKQLMENYTNADVGIGEEKRRIFVETGQTHVAVVAVCIVLTVNAENTFL